MSNPFPENCGKPADQQASRLRTLVNGTGEPPLTLLDRLSVTRGVWELLDTQPEEATKLLLMQPSGTFIVASGGAVGSASRVLLLRTEEDGSDNVRHFHIKEDGAAIYLEGSQLRFRDPVELIGFHVVSRDILPCLLRIPDAFRLPCKLGLDAVVALGMKFWMMLLPPGSELTPTEVEKKPLGLNGDPLEPERPACSIRVTSEDGALCVINPLYLSVHSHDSWQDFMPSLCRSSNTRGTLKVWNGPERSRTSDSDPVSRKGTCPTRECLDHQRLQEEEEEEGEEEEKSDFLPCSSSLRRRSFCRSLAWKSSEHASEVPPPSPEPKEIRSPHRVSWIEGIPVTTPPSWPLKKSSSELSLLSEAMLLPLIPELDSLSVSSVEDEGDTLASAATSHKKRHSSSAVLPYKVLHRLSAVGSALSGLLSTERRISNRVQDLAQEPTSYLGGLVQSFVGHILRGAGMRHPTSTDMLQEIRQMLSSLKGYLCESSDLHVFADHIEAEDLNLGSVVETALYKCMLKPLRDAVYTHLLEFRTRDGTMGRLREHQAAMKQQSLEELGVTACVPDGAGLDRIRTKLNLLHQAYSPKKKEVVMLKVCKMLYEAMNQAAGRTEPFGADDFLPVLTYTLVNCDIVSAQLDVEYMMELMDPTQLQGEGGYYLTTWFGALYHIANFQPAAMVTRQISLEAQHSIHQWHRRRTIHHHHHHHQQVARSHSQNILYVSFLEPFSNQKTLSVPPDVTAASVCAACAEKYNVSNPEAYGLFLVSSDSSQLLAGDSCPQRLRSAVFLSQGPPVSFVYKTLDGALPAADPASLHDPNKRTETQKALRSGHLEGD